jgi:FkbM family methyltransferase
MSLVYDIGMHNGDDTAYYLAKGHSVVAVEANPQLVERGRSRFQRELADKTLEILNVGISDVAGPATFWINEHNDEWSSFRHEIGCRDGTQCHAMEIECTTIGAILERFGSPLYMKIDIEGNDVLCLEGLTAETAPPYLSVEAHRLEYLVLLYNLGYRQFKCIDQTDHNWTGRPTGVRLVDAARRRVGARLRTAVGSEDSYSRGSSGPFGEESRGKWKDLETVAYEWLRMRHGKRPLNPHGWYDFHAKLTP